MTIEEIRRRIYHLYQLDWLAQNGHSIYDALHYVGKEMYEIMIDLNEIQDFQSLLDEAIERFEGDVGFNGSLYVCYDEFLGCEYLDSEYILFLIEQNVNCEELKQKYLEDIKDE